MDSLYQVTLGDELYQVDEDGVIVNGPEWTCETPEEADRIVERIAYHEAQVLSLQSQIESLTGNLKAIQNDHLRRRNWLEARFIESLERIARMGIGESRSKTFALPHAKLQFRMSRGKISVADKTAAVSYLESMSDEWAEKALTFDPRIRVGELKGHEDVLPDCFDIEWPREEFKINTGIKLPKGLDEEGEEE